VNVEKVEIKRPESLEIQALNKTMKYLSSQEVLVSKNSCPINDSVTYHRKVEWRRESLSGRAREY